MQVLDVRALILGKLLHGIFVTIVHIASVKMITETLPHNLIGPYGTSIPLVMTTGYMLTCVFGLGLPEGDYNPAMPLTGPNLKAYQANVEDHFWRVILAFPLLMNFFLLSIFFIWIRTDSIMFNLSKNDSQSVLYLIDKVYDSGECRDTILASLQSQVSEKPKTEESMCQALFGVANRKKTLYMMVFTSLIQQTAVNVFNMYCNRIFTVMNASMPSESKVLANRAT